MNLILFMLAGYETTSTTLSYCAYVLATHPEEQAILYEEINSVFSDDLNGDEDENISIDHEKINQLEYMRMFINEVLRMYPIGNS